MWWQLGRLRSAVVGGADRRSAKNADAPMNESREAHLAVRPLHSPEGGPCTRRRFPNPAYGGAQGNPSEVRDCHQSKQSILLRLLLAADQHVCAPGRTRTCNLRIRSETPPVCLAVVC
jgi:hypothetical protein